MTTSTEQIIGSFNKASMTLIENEIHNNSLDACVITLEAHITELIDNHVVASEIDVDHNGTQYKPLYNLVGKTEQRVTVVDIFPSHLEAKYAVVECQRQGLSCQQIWLIAHDYQSSPSSNHHSNIAAVNCLVLFLNQLGISNPDAGQYVEAIKDGKFLVVAIVNDQEASQAQHILKNIGHWAIAVY